jgi:N-acetylmuramoyl-L-alanine amidase
VQKNPNLYEVRTPAAPTVYCECEFHDTVEGAKWIVEHTTEIGEAIAKGLCKYLGVTYVPTKQESPKPAQPTGDKLYRVQVGAFAVRENAEKMLKRLKDAGFDGFIREGSR